MDHTDQRPQTTDEQLGSAGFSFEMGWLAGVVLGTLVVVSAVRRRARRNRDAIAHS
jgi:hypothetical protein